MMSCSAFVYTGIHLRSSQIISNNGLLVRAITDILFYIDLIGTMVEIN